MGGPMMGFALKDDQSPITKASNCLLISVDDEISKPQSPQLPCIRCGHCVDVCPARLLPQQLYWYASAQNFDRIKEHRLFDCIECGCCSYVCPSHIPLVQYYRYAKAEIRQIKFDTNDSDKARQRYEDRNLRLENIKIEREQRLKRKRELLKNKSSGDNKQKAIEEALARVAAKKSEMNSKDNNK
jgi:electron transport complex protein RnfC